MLTEKQIKLQFCTKQILHAIHTYWSKIVSSFIIQDKNVDLELKSKIKMRVGLPFYLVNSSKYLPNFSFNTEVTDVYRLLSVYTLNR